MRKNELIHLLKSIPGNPRVAILDVKKNHDADQGEGTAEGVHGDFEIFQMNKEHIPAGVMPWVAIAFLVKDSDLVITAAPVKTK